MYEIGGYFGLELRRGQPLHHGGVAVNSARNALRLLLAASGVRRIHLPHYICPALMPAIQAENVEVAFYPLTAELDPSAPGQLMPDEALLVVNYFGLKDAMVKRMAETAANVIVDQCQALFSAPPRCLGSIYSPRKFVGVADGGYLYTDLAVTQELPQACSSERYQYALQRIDEGARAGFHAYQAAESQLAGQAPASMSALTGAVLASIDYAAIAARRRSNYERLHAVLADSNQLVLPLEPQAVPMVYPFLCTTQGLRDHLVGQGVYTATYWPDPDGILPHNRITDRLVNQLVALPIDQRYGVDEMDIVAGLVTDYLASAGPQKVSER